ncbi:MAG TPA: FUSC family protein [Candidatus Nanopelagicales bacterium]
MGYVRTLWGSVAAMDRTKIRRWSAVRRGVLVPVTMVAGTVLVDAETGALAGMSALFVGLQERNASASYTSRVMGVQSVVFAGVVLVAGSLSQVQAIPVALLTLTAVAAGLVAFRDKAMSRMFGDVMPIAAFLGLSVVDPRESVVMSVAVLLGGLSQALLARLSVRFEGDLMERRPVAAALVAVADHLDDALARRLSTTGRAAEERLLTALGVLDASDLVADRRRNLRALLTDAELLRQEAAAIRMRRAIDMPVGVEDQIEGGLATASRALRTVAIALTSVGIPGRYDYTAEAALADLYPCRQEAEAVVRDRAADPTARAVSRRVLRLYRHTAALVEARADRSEDRARRVGEGLLGHLLHPGRRDLVVGLRLGAATLISFAVAFAFHLPHGAWVASTTVSLLRPDWRALTTDTVARSLGTAAAAALTLPLVWAAGGHASLEMLLILVLSTATYVIATVNEGLYVMTTAMVVLFSRSILGDDPLHAAASRVLDVAVGAAIAVVFLVLIPVSHGRRLAKDLAAYSEAAGAWLVAVAELASGANPRREKALRREMREARVLVQHGIELRTIEPYGGGMSARHAEQLFSQVHEAARSAAAAERALKHGQATGPGSEVLALDAAAMLQLLALGLRGDPLRHPPPNPPAVPVEPEDIVMLLLHRTDDLAHAAVASLSATSTPTPA